METKPQLDNLKNMFSDLCLRLTWRLQALAYFWEFFWGGAKSIVMQISIVVLLFSDQISGRGKSFQGGLPEGGRPFPPVEESHGLREDTKINFVLYNVILAFGGRGFLICRFPIFLLYQNQESDGLSEIVL